MNWLESSSGNKKYLHCCILRTLSDAPTRSLKITVWAYGIFVKPTKSIFGAGSCNTPSICAF